MSTRKLLLAPFAALALLVAIACSDDDPASVPVPKPVATVTVTPNAKAMLVGAIPGAIPPMMGWTAARGTLDLQAWILFAILFIWQLPHFLAIAWLYREDYAAARMPLLPVLEPDGHRTGRQALLYGEALWPVSLMPALVGLSGGFYTAIATVLGLTLIALCARFARDRSARSARQLFLFSIIQLPILQFALVADRLWI